MNKSIGIGEAILVASGDPAVRSSRSDLVTVVGLLMITGGVLNTVGIFPPYQSDGISLSSGAGTLAFNLLYSLLLIAVGFLVIGGNGTRFARIGLGATSSLGLLAFSERLNDIIWLNEPKTTFAAEGFLLQTLGDFAAFVAALLAIAIVAKSIFKEADAGTENGASRDRTLALVLLGLITAGATIASATVDQFRESARGRDVVNEIYYYGNWFSDVSWQVVISLVLTLVVTLVVLVGGSFVRERAVALGLVIGVAGYWISLWLYDVVTIMAGTSKEYYGFSASEDAQFPTSPTPEFAITVMAFLLILVMVAVYWFRNATRPPGVIDLKKGDTIPSMPD